MLSGNINNDLKNRIAKAGFDEVYTLIGLLLGSAGDDVHECIEERRLLESVKLCINEYRTTASEVLDPADNMKRLIGRIEAGRESGLKAHSLTREESDRMLRTASCLYDMAARTASVNDYDSTFEIIREASAGLVAAHNENVDAVRARLDNLFSFAEQCWDDDKEMLMIVTELTADPDRVSFISTYGCDGYYKHNKNLLFDERSAAIEQQIDKLEL
jgi:hypothetical protein